MRPYISFVATTRNDNHGGDLTRRMNMFLRALAQQCDRHRLPAELILVEWNPPADRPPLAEALAWPNQGGMLETVIVTVPREVHAGYRYADGYPLYQMIAKNVGIRRARGEFILATNVDILFSEELMENLAQQNLERGYEYRVDRFDVDMPLPDPESLEAQSLLAECGRHLIRHNDRLGSHSLRNGELTRIYRDDKGDGRDRLHTNACGDFALTHRDHWFETEAYPELDLFSFHIDSLWCYQAHFAGVREKCFAPPLAIFHIEHGEGYTPETLKKMDGSLQKKKVPRLSTQQFNAFATRMSRSRKRIRFNRDNWGLADENLPVTTPLQAGWSSGSPVILNERRRTGIPKISLVVTARNDNHGENLLPRIQTFLDGWRQGASSEGLASEIVFVEWNPPEDKPRLAEVLEWEPVEGVDLRFITISPPLHRAFIHSDRIPLFQMIAKNVGIRRARADWILTTNVDVLFNKPFFNFFAKASLDPSAFYRMARYDTSARTIEGNSLDGRIEFCEQRIARIQANNQTLEARNGEVLPPHPKNLDLSGNGWVESLLIDGEKKSLFSNACGDFTLMHRDAWAKMRGYPEIPVWSIFIDGLALHAALGMGMRQVELGEPLRMFHIEHGGGWAVDDGREKKDIRLDYSTHYRSWSRFLARNGSESINPPDWGLANLELEESPRSSEIAVSSDRSEKDDRAPAQSLQSAMETA